MTNLITTADKIKHLEILIDTLEKALEIALKINGTQQETIDILLRKSK